MKGENMSEYKTVCWWSGGITSAVACKLAIEKHDAVPVFIETGSHHEDTQRFKKDCEKWYGKEIITIQSKFKDHFEVIEKFKYVNGPRGARCTSALKRSVREKWEKNKDVEYYVWGFEFAKREIARAERLNTTAPDFKHLFPLIDNKLSKKDCVKVVTDAGIAPPIMYRLGFQNNNCIGCVKGGMAYWNKIRQHFPEHFEKMAKLERKIGRSSLKKYFLDELPPDAGRGQPPIVQECGATGEGCATSISKEYYAERSELEPD